MDSWPQQQLLHDDMLPQQQPLVPQSSSSDSHLCPEMFRGSISRLIADPPILSVAAELEPLSCSISSVHASSDASLFHFSFRDIHRYSEELEPPQSSMMNDEAHQINLVDADTNNLDYRHNPSVLNHFGSPYALPSDSATTVISSAASFRDDQSGFDLHYSGLDQSDNNSRTSCQVPKKIKMSRSAAASSRKAPVAAAANQAQFRKLGQKITALQQLVAPFGKTDTASVLSEAIGYIKFLQEQLHVLSSPYMVASATGADVGKGASSDLWSIWCQFLAQRAW